ncbi:uncharacterized protein LOC120420081 isoform X2 [Culex pipiens pallens]|uniref:uncharacterized protein LOC120420081 isoform X2 n=2 Tax=Culex pipiens pallens TaxID=42434 RepID=UPI001954F297|nr:uncharacterized protein LOC120420081 isoform X2 [Culex pipiens pallens]
MGYLLRDLQKPTSFVALRFTPIERCTNVGFSFKQFQPKNPLFHCSQFIMQPHQTKLQQFRAKPHCKMHRASTTAISLLLALLVVAVELMAGTETCGGANEQFNQCGTACERTCENFNQTALACTHNCVRGCFCVQGFVRDVDRNCVTPDDC